MKTVVLACLCAASVLAGGDGDVPPIESGDCWSTIHGGPETTGYYLFDPEMWDPAYLAFPENPPPTPSELADWYGLTIGALSTLWEDLCFYASPPPISYLGALSGNVGAYDGTNGIRGVPSTNEWAGYGLGLTTEVWTARGLARYFTLFFIDISTRRVYVAGSTMHATSEWMARIARNVSDCQDGRLLGKRFLIVDRDSIFTRTFKAILESAGVGVLTTAYQAPNMNAYAERFVRSIRSECLDQIMLVGERSLETAIAEYVGHYHEERTHQGLGNELVSGASPQRDGAVAASERLGAAKVLS